MVFAVGQARALLGKGAKAIEGASLFELFPPSERPRLEQALARMREGRRISALSLGLLPGEDGVTPHDVWLSGYRMAGEFEGHFFLALSQKRKSLPPLEESGRSTRLPDREEFAAIAKARLAEASQAGLDYDLMLLELPEVAALAAKAGPEAALKFKDDLALFLRDHSVGGDSAGLLDETKFAFVHAGNLSEGVIRDKIAELARGAGHPVAVQMASLDLDASGISDEEAAQALVYTINQFSRREGSFFTVDALQKGLHSALSGTVSEMGRLKSLVTKGRFNLAYQPVVSLADGSVHHFECLARLETAEAGDASPFRLVTFAEDTGLIGHLDQAIYERVVAQMHRNFMGDRAVSLAVNLSGHSLSDAAFMKRLFKLLDDSPPFGARLLFEMTESAEVRDLAAVNAQLQQLRKRGHPVCLDDFGAGNAAFHYLRALSVDFVKIDGSYVQHVLTRPQDVPFLKAIAQLCREMKIAMIAEMIEDAQTVDLLKHLGVQFGQGYYFGRPTHGLGEAKSGGVPAGFERRDGLLYWNG